MYFNSFNKFLVGKFYVLALLSRWKKNEPLSLKDVQICLLLTEGNVFFRFFFLNLMHHRWLAFFFAIIPNTSIIFYVLGGKCFLDE